MHLSLHSWWLKLVYLATWRKSVLQTSVAHIATKWLAFYILRIFINQVLKDCHWTSTLMSRAADTNLGVAAICPDEVSCGILNLSQGSSETVLWNGRRTPLSKILCPHYSWKFCPNRQCRINQPISKYHRKTRSEALTETSIKVLLSWIVPLSSGRPS